MKNYPSFCSPQDIQYIYSIEFSIGQTTSEIACHHFWGYFTFRNLGITFLLRSFWDFSVIVPIEFFFYTWIQVIISIQW